MKLKLKTATLAIAVAGLWPAAALCAEGAGAEQGSWFELIFYAINFLLFVAVLVRYAGPAIRKFFKDRASTIRGTLTQADAALKDAQALAARAQERMARLEAEKTRIASEMADETVYQIGRIYDLANEGAARLRRDTELTGAAIKESAQRRIRTALAQVAGTLARDLVARNFVPSDQSRLLEAFSQRLEEEARTP